jgi:hypothetical protein
VSRRPGRAIRAAPATKLTIGGLQRRPAATRTFRTKDATEPFDPALPLNRSLKAPGRTVLPCLFRPFQDHETEPAALCVSWRERTLRPAPPITVTRTGALTRRSGVRTSTSEREVEPYRRDCHSEQEPPADGILAMDSPAGRHGAHPHEARQDVQPDLSVRT